MFGHTHRNERLHLLLILPDGSKSLVPAEWTNLHATPDLTVHNQGATLASLDELLRLRTVVDALLRRLAAAAAEAAKPSNEEESNRAKAAQLSGHRFPGNVCVAAVGPATQDQANRSPGPTDRQGSLEQQDAGT